MAMVSENVKRLRVVSATSKDLIIKSFKEGHLSYKSNG
ncbi:hypothetical protein BCO_0900076 (plasmid) [Borrelia coriaceae ATCC 43381]|uniref:Uncharacterized protein n=1 Tax=Borrelia coriaceae ATCC 43381 TaxID=1408429 RepID=W5SWS2_9SPIR|nr:hypothetical protein BCO_0900076 [Borrelia coriaceae ATCC 43381]